MKEECFMENIIQEVKDGFEDINKLSSILNCDYSFDPPASYEEISVELSRNVQSKKTQNLK